MVHEVENKELAEAHLSGALVVDVREPGEYAAGHVSGAKLVPLAGLSSRVDDLPRGGRIYVICASGNRSRTGAEVLTAAGLDAVSVKGGTRGWVESGRQVVRGMEEGPA